MKSRKFWGLTAILALLVSLFPAPAALAFKDDDGEFRMKGVIESLPGGGLIGTWRVSGRAIVVTSSTRIELEGSPVRVGAFVEVKGHLNADGSVRATKIETKGGAGVGDDFGEIKGTIESLPAGGLIGDWRVAGRTVRVTSATIINQEHGPAVVGAFVEVHGTPQSDGSVTATHIEVKPSGGSGGPGGGGPGGAEIKFKGTIQLLPSGGFIGAWLIGGRTVNVTASTEIKQEDGPVAIGAFVEVEGSTQPDGSINAREIDVKSNVAGGDGRHELKGVIEALPASGFVGAWTVSGRTVIVSASTVIEQNNGPAVVGALVEVKGSLNPDGTLTATKIETKQSFGSGTGSSRGGRGKVVGAIESLPAGTLIGQWIVAGRTVHVTAATRIKQQHGAVGVGVRVKVKGTRLADGSIAANVIQVKD